MRFVENLRSGSVLTTATKRIKSEESSAQNVILLWATTKSSELILWLKSISRPLILWYDNHPDFLSHWSSFAKFAALQALNFIVTVINIRALAHLQYGWAVLTDGLVCFLAWTLMKQIGEAKDPYSRIGYIVGGMIGSLVGMWLTKVWG